MCGIVGAVSRAPVNQLLYDGLMLLQHRGQDAAGIVTSEGNVFHMHKGPGYVRDVFRTRNMRDLTGSAGIVFFHKAHDVDALWAQRSADGRRWRCLAGGQLQLNDCFEFLCHD